MRLRRSKARAKPTDWDRIRAAAIKGEDQLTQARHELARQMEKAERERVEVREPLRGFLARNHLGDLMESAFRGRGDGDASHQRE